MRVYTESVELDRWLEKQEEYTVMSSGWSGDLPDADAYILVMEPDERLTEDDLKVLDGKNVIMAKHPIDIGELALWLETLKV